MPDVQAPILRTGLTLPDRLATKYGWLDANHLAVTATHEGDQDSYSGFRRLMVVDTRTGAQRTVLANGFLTCANPHTGLVGAYVGDLRNMLRGESFPKPTFKWFRWQASSGQLEEQPQSTSEPWHREHCRAYEKEEDENGQVSTGSAPVRYLEPGHGQIRWTHDFEKREAVDVRWERGSSRRALAIDADSVSPFVEWLPFRRTYLVAAGSFLHIHKQRPVMRPTITMDLQGRLVREPLSGKVSDLLARIQASQAWSIPVRDANLLIVPGRSHEGAGFYRVGVQGLQRVLCVTPAGESRNTVPIYAKNCFENEAIKLSPDGCQLAFVSRHDFGADYRSMNLRGEIHALDLCRKP